MRKQPMSTWPWLAVFSIVLVTGCVRSLHPIYTESSLVFEPALLGEWRQQGGHSTWRFTETVGHANHRAYRLVMTDSQGRGGMFLAHLVTLGEHRFLDLCPEDPLEGGNAFYRHHLQRAHTFLRVEVDGDTARLRAFVPEVLEERLEQRPDALRHTYVTTAGRPATGNEGSVLETLFLTAPTAELRAFFEALSREPGAFTDQVGLNKVE